MEKEDTHGHKEHDITVYIDGNPKKIQGGEYVVSRLKEVLGVPADKVLEIVKEDGLKPLEDTDTIHVHEGEKFAAHVRKGGSS